MSIESITRRSFIQGVLALGLTSTLRSQERSHKINEILDWDTAQDKLKVDKEIQMYPILSQIIYGNGTFVTAGRMIVRPEGEYSSIAVFSLKDGKWHKKIFPGEGIFNYRICCVNDEFYFIGEPREEGPKIKFVSKDGLNWAKDIDQTPKYRGVRGKGLYVRIDPKYEVLEGDYGDIFVSRDQIEWELKFKDTLFRAITYGDGLYVAFGNQYFEEATGRFVGRKPYLDERVGGYYGLHPLIASAEDIDGKWTIRSLDSAINHLYSITYGNGRFVAIGYKTQYGNHDTEIIISDNGKEWRKVNTGIKREFEDITYGNGQFMAVGAGALCSKDGEKWETVLKHEPLVIKPK